MLILQDTGRLNVICFINEITAKSRISLLFGNIWLSSVMHVSCYLSVNTFKCYLTK